MMVIIHMLVEDLGVLSSFKYLTDLKKTQFFKKYKNFVTINEAHIF